MEWYTEGPRALYSLYPRAREEEKGQEYSENLEHTRLHDVCPSTTCYYTFNQVEQTFAWYFVLLPTWLHTGFIRKSIVPLP